ncbi:MAG: hypothetical protein K2X38_07600 [Gemmataceae bacterium]|nr:hypothetical protein [Gemmataceae bacterium]
MRTVLAIFVAIAYVALLSMAACFALFAWILRDGLGPDAPPDSTGWLAAARFVSCWLSLFYHVYAHWLVVAIAASHIGLRLAPLEQGGPNDSLTNG